jgi:uncharacterized protein
MSSRSEIPVYNRTDVASKRLLAIIIFGGIISAIAFYAHNTGLLHLAPALASLTLLLAPLWFFGFGLGDWLSERIVSPAYRIAAVATLAIPYLVFAIATGQLRWSVFLFMVFLAVGAALLLHLSRSNPRLTWQDAVVLTVLVAAHLLRIFEPAWPAQFAALPKLFLIDVILYLYTVIRPLPQMGYSLVPTIPAVRIGFREWLFFLPIGVGLGTAMHFTHFHAHWPFAASFGLLVFATFLFVAIPEELFFRGILQNVVETRLRRTPALILASILFGLSHYHRGGTFDPRYILLAAIAGIFYGRAWRARHQLLAAILTHTAVDVVWSTWFR